VSPGFVEVGGVVVREGVEAGDGAQIEAFNPVGLEYLLMTALVGVEVEVEVEVVEFLLATSILAGESSTPPTTRDWGPKDVVARYA
jgi:hypothetical protein